MKSLCAVIDDVDDIGIVVCRSRFVNNINFHLSSFNLNDQERFINLVALLFNWVDK